MSTSLPHILWKSTSSDPRDIRRASIKAKILVGIYILQYNRASFNQTSDATCPLCQQEKEDIPHFLLTCPALVAQRDPLLHQILYSIPLVYSNHPAACRWPRDLLTQLLLDPSHERIQSNIDLESKIVYTIERLSRQLCYALHVRRTVLLDEKGRRKKKHGVDTTNG